VRLSIHTLQIVNVRAALIFLVLGFFGLLLVMGTLGFVRWLKVSYPRHFRVMLLAILLGLVGSGIWVYIEASERPIFHAGDQLTLHEPLVGRLLSADRGPTTSCIVDIHEHVGVVEEAAGALTLKVESNTRSGPSFCPTGAQIRIEAPWLHRYTLTHGH